MYSDPHTATIKLRCFAESLVGILYRELNLPSDPLDGFFEKLKAHYFLDVVDEAVVQKLHAIRVLGNKAAHGHTITTESALSLMKEAFLISQWFYWTFSGVGCTEYPSYVAPIQPPDQPAELSQVKEKLSEQLTAARDELARLEASEKAAQMEIASLNQSLDQAKLQTFKDSATQAARFIDFDAAATRSLISIHDTFAEYTLNDGQAELVNQLEKFLGNTAESVFLLKGYAGTGKTFITKGLTEYFHAIGRNYVLAAPTGKASKVIANKTKSAAYTIHKTIYSLNDLVEYRDDDLDGSETYKFYAQLRVNSYSVDTVYIIDEASMISDNYQDAEFFRFGTGYLLTDFLKFVNLDHNDHSKKIIFIGDDAQLPPVGMKFSPALSVAYLSQNHHVHSTGYELTEVVRQKSESGVIANAIPLRKALHTGVFNQLEINLGYPDVAKVDYENILAQYLTSCSNKISGESIIIAYSNADVADFNRMIRGHFFPEKEEVVAGDKVMATVNSDINGIFVSNGDFGLIRRVIGKSEKRTITIKKKISKSNDVESIPVPLIFKDVEIGFKDIEGVPHFFQTKVFECLLYDSEPGLSSDQSKALYLDFCIRNPNLRRKSVEFKNSLKGDPYFNAMRLKFGYAITCHKAQGSEWNHVFVKCKSHQSQLTADYFRWFYTAITRTAYKLYLLDPPHLPIRVGVLVHNPGMGLNAQVAMTSIKQNSISINEAVSQTTSNSKLDKLETFGILASASFLLAVLGRVRALIDGYNVLIDSITHNQYQEAYFFSRDSETVRINIGYNSRNKVTYTPAMKLTELTTEIVNILSPLQGSTIVVEPSEPTQNIVFDKPFLNDFHQKVLSVSAEAHITVKNVVSQQWSLRYTFARDSQVAVYDVWYNKKCQFNRCQPLITACTPGELVSDVGELLTNGMGL